MKKILLATTVLAASAGYAAAEVSFAGSGEMGIADYAGAGWASYAGATLDVTMSGTSDSGLTFGATASVSVGHSFDGLDDGIVAAEGVASLGEVYVEGSFGRIAMARDGYTEFHADTNSIFDIDYSGTFGAVSVGLRADVEGGATSAKVGYTAGSLTLGANMDDTGDWDASASYAMGQITVGVTTDSASASSVSVDYDNGAGMTAGVEIDSDNAWTLSGGYSANGMSVNAEIASDNSWEVTGSYDLGGGLTIEGGADNDNDMFIGAAMTF